MQGNRILNEYIRAGNDVSLSHAGIDWITLTGRYSPSSRKTQCCDLWEAIKLDPKEWRGMGYSGFICKESKVRYGARVGSDGDVEEIIIGSGDVAVELAQLYMDDKGDLRVTRVDLQSTYRIAHRDCDLASRGYDMLNVLGVQGAKPTGKRAYNLVRSATGDTLYIGKRGSRTKFFRFYDKGGQMGEEKGVLWRQEVQFNRKFAMSALNHYELVQFDPPSVSNIVVEQFLKECGFSVIGLLPGVVNYSVKPNVSRETNYERILNWLISCVRPAVSDLLELGLEYETRKALGLEEREFKNDSE